MPKNIFKTLQQKFPDSIFDAYTYRDDAIVVVDKEGIYDICKYLRDDSVFQFDLLMDLAGVDYMGRDPRFEVVYTLYSLKNNNRLRIKAPIDERNPQIQTLSSLWKIADWYEREVWDMYGVFFHSHPDMRRILTDYGFEGHPQRKDFPLSGYVEVRYDDTEKRVVTEPVEIAQVKVFCGKLAMKHANFGKYFIERCRLLYPDLTQDAMAFIFAQQ